MSVGPGKKCGPHVELVSNEQARVTRCTCGTVHVTLNGNGVTLRLSPDALRHAANALSASVRLIDLTEAAGAAASDVVN